MTETSYNPELIRPVTPKHLWRILTDEELRKYAEGLYPDAGQREGVVIRPMKEVLLNGERVSFKVINLKFKD